MAKLKVKPEFDGKVQADVQGRTIVYSNETSQADLKTLWDANPHREFFVGVERSEAEPVTTPTDGTGEGN